MEKPKAVILAAGMGTRLGPLTSTFPKTLLRINGKSLLKRSLDCLYRVGIKEIIIVTGHCSNVIQKEILEEYKSMKITYVHNLDFPIRHILV